MFIPPNAKCASAIQTGCAKQSLPQFSAPWNEEELTGRKNFARQQRRLFPRTRLSIQNCGLKKFHRKFRIANCQLSSRSAKMLRDLTKSLALHKFRPNVISNFKS